MLKIKDDADLKELEKFGFIERTLGDSNKILYKPKKTERDVIEIEVNIETRELELSQVHDLFHTHEDTLYDLIQAGLIEKVGGTNEC